MKLNILVAALVVATAVSAQAQTRNAPVLGTHAVREAQLLLPSSTPRRAFNAETPAPAPDAVPAGGFASSGFAQFMSSPAGRLLRVVAGAGMIAGGVSMDSNGGNALAIAGVLPLAAGTFDICWISPLFGGPLRGKDIRAAK